MSDDRFGTKFDRLYAAVVTPYKEDYDLDEAALRKFLQYFMQPKFMDAGGGIIINSGAGECYYMNRDEKRRCVEIAVEVCGGKVPVFAGVLDLRTVDAINLAIDAKEAGADGLFLVPPMGLMDIAALWEADKYPEVWIDMAKAQVEAVDLPAIAFPITAPSPGFGPGLPLKATLQMIREIPNIVGWKMVYHYNNYKIIAKALRALDRHIALLYPHGSFFHEYLATSYFDGTLTGTLSYAMEPMIDHIKAWRDRDIDEACRIWESGLADLQEYIYSGTRWHIRFKAATWLRGLIPLPYMRPPVPKPRKEELLKLRELLTRMEFSVIPEDDLNRIMAQLPY